MEVRLRYVIAKKRAGRYLYYWQRKGFASRRLPDDPNSAKFFELVERLNRDADAEREGRKGPEDGSFAWLVEKYLASPDAAALAPRTQKNYRYFLSRLTRQFGHCPLDDLDRETVYEIRDFFSETPSLANQIVETLRTLLSWAVDRGILAENHALKPRRMRVRPRNTVWTREQEKAFLAAADETMRLAFMLGAYTAQRLADVCAMPWAHYDGKSISLRQQKTKALVRVPCHADLRAILDQTEKRSLMILTTATGLPFKPSNFNVRWKAIAKTAGIHGAVQFRDLRRTAMVRLAEAGANAIQIAAISGHDIGVTQKILETYIPRNAAMAEAAILSWERSK